MSDEEKPGPASGWLTMRFVRYYLVGYSGFVLLLSSLTGVLGMLMLADGQGPVLAVLAMYGYASGLLMLVGWDQLRRKTLNATKWTRVALMSALPGSALTGTVSGYLCLALATEVSASDVRNPVALPFLAFGILVLMGSILNVGTLLAVLSRDLDKLLWARHEEGIPDDELNFVEEGGGEADVQIQRMMDEVEIGFETEDEEETEQSAASHLR